jgi:tetratricopeptide (TPR) repeat protein
MKKIIILSFLLFAFIGCNSPQPVNVSPQSSNNSTSVTSHSTNIMPTQNQADGPKSETKTKWSQGGNPIDTSEFDAAIASAEKNSKAKPKDEAAKKALAEAFYKRGFALTDARQYASALGDYRKALKFDPNHADAKIWISKIIEIYDGLNKSYPAEGEEPPALPFKKEK